MSTSPSPLTSAKYVDVMEVVLLQLPLPLIPRESVTFTEA